MSINPLSLSWWGNTLLQAFVIMVMFYILKTVFGKFDIPLVSEVVAKA